MRHATITGTGSFVPARVVANAELSAALGEDIDAFVANTLGIRARRWCAPDASTAARAGAVALELPDVPGRPASELYADGALAPGMGVFAGGTAEPITVDVLNDGTRNRLRFVQKYPKEVNEEGWPRIARSVLERIGR